MIGGNGIRNRPGLRTMILGGLYWDIREVCDPLFLCGLVLDAALVIYGWFRLPKRVWGVHRNTKEHVQQVNLVLSFYSAAAAAADYLATNFLDDFPSHRAERLGRTSATLRLDRGGSRKLYEGSQYARRRAEPVDLFALDVVGSKSGGRVWSWGCGINLRATSPTLASVSDEEWTRARLESRITLN